MAGTVEQVAVPPTTNSNRWRWHYRSPPVQYAKPPDVRSPGINARGAARILRGKRDKQKSAAAQMERLRLTGFSGPDFETANQVHWALRQLGVPDTAARYGAHLVACGAVYNFQGHKRIGQLMGKSVRAIRRARALLEAEGYITSYLLEPGDIIAGQRMPVRRYQVVRDVRRLRALATIKTKPLAPHRRSASRRNTITTPPSTGKPSAAEVPRVTAADLHEIASMTAESWVAACVRNVANAGARPPAEAPSPEAIDVVIDRERGELQAIEQAPSAPREALTGSPLRPS
jgi:hypothetical protein